MRTVPFLLVLGLQAAVVAQTLVVDAANGPGTHYTDLATAVAAAPEGAMLQVRPGQYGPFQVLAKSLTISFAAGAHIRTPNSWSMAVGIDGLGAGQSVFLRGLQFDPYVGALDLRDNLGFVDIEGAATTNALVTAQNCDRVRLLGFAFTSGTQVTASNVVFERCSIRGSTFAAAPGLTQNGGSVQLVESTVDGGEGFTSVTAGPAVLMNGGSLRALGGGHLSRGAIFYNNGSSPPPPHAISGTGTVRIDPSVDLPANQTIGPCIVVT